MAGLKEKYLISKMSTVVVIDLDGKDLKQEEDKINKRVEKKVKEIIDQLKISHNKFEDPDFGPRPDDEFGAISLYGGKAPEPAGSKYPAPESLRWERPLYTDDKFGGKDSEGKEEEDGEEDEEEEEEEEDEFGFGGGGGEKEVFCENGRLFIDGSSSGDVIQGQLGDCWFLSALAVLGADDNLLENCFWRREEFREYGLYVLRFYKDCSLFFVIIDDRLPVKDKDGRLIFAGGKDPNELWVPLIEKAYGKLHGCYKALIGGYTHNGLADMTGFSPRLVVMREGYLGFSQRYEPDDLWALLTRYSSWKSMMGCSIQPAPNDKRKVEAEAGQGLHMSHAYSFLALGEIKDKKTGKTIRLVKLRNPWGRGEWEGKFSDNSVEREENEAEIARVFDSSVKAVEKSTINHADGTFFMPYEDWLLHFTSLFVAIHFPSEWLGKRVGGLWSGEQGGNRDMGTWITNPKFKLRLETTAGTGPGEYRPVFIGLYIKDSRLTMGFDYYKDPLYATPLTFDVVTAAELSGSNATQKNIPKAVRFYPIPPGKAPEPCVQPPYNFGSAQVEVYLQPNEDYYIIPSLYKRNQPGEFFLTVYAQCDKLQLDGSAVVSETHKPMQVAEGKVTLKMSVAQFNEKKESLRDRIVSEAKRLNISYVQIRNLLLNNNQESLSRSVFKRRIMDAGFMLTDFPDDDFVVLDGDTGFIKINEFLDFIAKGMSFEEGVTNLGPPPSKPIDDLLFKAIDLSGELRVHINSARGLRDASAWFKNVQGVNREITNTAPSAATAGSGENSNPASAAGRPRTLINYDPVKAAAARQRAIKDRAVPPAPRFSFDATPPTTATTTVAAATSDSANSTAAANASAVGLSVQTEFGKMSPPGSPLRTFTLNSSGTANANTKNNNTNKAMTVVSQMSMTQKDIVSRAGAGAAIKLHTDVVLQRAEVKRTQNLSLLRASSSKKAGANASDATGASAGGKKEEEITIMRAKTKSSAGKKERRNIRAHVDVMQWLGIPLDGHDNIGSSTAPSVSARLPIRAGLQSTATTTGVASKGVAESKKVASSIKDTAVSAAVTVTGATASLSVLMPSTTTSSTTTNAATVAPAATQTSSTSANKGRPYDLWDLLIDNVYTICASRPVNAKTQRHRTFIEMKRKPIHSEQLRLLDEAATPLHAPSKTNRGGGNTPNNNMNNNNKTVNNKAGVPGMLALGTPKAKLISRGVASVKSAHVSKTQTKQTIVDAREKLLLLQQTMGKTYHEVYRRLLSIATTSYEEMSGERASKAQVTLSSDSTAYLRKLFEKFDTNGNGLISKEEFRLAMQDLNVDLSREDCDIFFNRFTGSVPGNINWKEFAEFFQHEIAGATIKAISSAAATNHQQGSNSSNSTSMKVGLDVNLVNMLMDLKRIVKDAVLNMQRQRITSIDQYLEASRANSNTMSNSAMHSARGVNANKPAPINVAEPKTPNPSNAVINRAKKVFAAEDNALVKLPPNAIFQTLTMSQVKSNAANMQALGLLHISETMMARISRIFDFSVTNIMDFILNHDNTPLTAEPTTATAGAVGSADNSSHDNGSSSNNGELNMILNEFDELMTKELLARGGSFHFGASKAKTAVDAGANNAAVDSKAHLGRSLSTPLKVSSNVTPNVLAKSTSQTNVPPLSLPSSNANNNGNSSSTPAAAAAAATAATIVTAPMDMIDPPHSTTAKIWSTFAPTLDALTPFDVIVRYLFSLLQECPQLQEKEIPLVSPRAMKDPMVRGIERKASHLVAPLSGNTNTALLSSSVSNAGLLSENNMGGGGGATVLTGKKLFFRGIDVSVLIRVVVDAMIYSSWNRLPAKLLAAAGGGAAALGGALAASVSGGGSSGSSGGSGGSSAGGKGSGGGSGKGGAGGSGGDKGGNGAPASLELVSFLSYSGLDAYVRNNRIAYIERKLQYLIHLEHDRTKSSTFFLVHVYLSHDGEEVVVLADDPLSGDVYKLHVHENVKALPAGETLKALFLQNKSLENAIQVASKLIPHRPVDHDALYLYNPIDTPQEEAAISSMLARLKLVRSQATNSAQLIFAEDPALIQQIKSLMDVSAKTLPFFYIVNDLYLSFEVDEMAIKNLDDLPDNHTGGKKAITHGASKTNAMSTSSSSAASSAVLAGGKNGNSATVRSPSVRSVVFGSIRNQKALCTFLTQVQSSLKVVLTTYNSTLRETFDWEEMLAHLSNQRNPFVTVQLLPKYIPPEKYLYEPHDAAKAFSGDDDDDSDDEPEPPSEDIVEEGLELPKHKSWQRSAIDYDGAPRPVWDANFAFNFHAPKMTNCEVHAREVVKLKLDAVTKYVMILIREGQRDKLTTEKGKVPEKEKFYFLTLYDPRSATEYQVGVKPNCELYGHLFYDRMAKEPQPTTTAAVATKVIKPATKEEYHNMELLRERVNQAAEKEDLYVGPAITPRFQICVYNHKDDKSKEMIGQSQVSVSAVLSGSGVSDRIWVKLVNMVEKPTAASAAGSNSGSEKMDEIKLVEEPAGEIEVELRFRRSIEMIGELKAKQNAKALQNEKRRRSTTLAGGVTAGDEGENDASAVSRPAAAGAAVKSMASSSTAGKVKELNQLLASTEEKLKRTEAEYAKLYNSTANNSKKSTDPATAAAAANEAKNPLQLIEQLEAEKKALAEEKAKIDAEREKWQREHAAVMTELHKLEEQVASNPTAANSKEGATTTPRGKLSDAKALAEVTTLKETNQQLLEQEKATKKAMEDMRVQLQRMKEEHAKTVEEMHRMKGNNSSSGGTTAGNGNSGAAAAGLVDVPAVPAMDVNHVLQILWQRYERKMKVTGAVNAPVTAGAILDTLQRLLHSFATPEGMITQRELLLAFSELMIDVSTEFVVKVVADSGPDTRKMVQVHSVMEYFKRELNQLLKAQQRKVKNELRMSQEGPVLGSKAAAAVAAANGNNNGENKPRPASAVVQGSGKAAVAAMKNNNSNNKDDNDNSKPLRSQSAKNVTSNHHAAVADAPSAAADEWHKQPLPPNWDCTFYEKDGRYVYINHKTRKTSWYHPLDPRHRKPTAGNSNNDIGTAQPARPSGNKPEKAPSQERLTRTVEIPRTTNTNTNTSAAANATAAAAGGGNNSNGKEALNRTYSGPDRSSSGKSKNNEDEEEEEEKDAPLYDETEDAQDES